MVPLSCRELAFFTLAHDQRYKRICTTRIRYLDNIATFSVDQPVAGDFPSAVALSSLRATLTELVTASILVSDRVKKSPVDLWEDIKIPYMEASYELSNPPRDNLWIPIGEEPSKTWSSPSGLEIQASRSDAVSSFSVNAAYLDVSCSDVVLIA